MNSTIEIPPHIGELFTKDEEELTPVEKLVKRNYEVQGFNYRIYALNQLCAGIRNKMLKQNRNWLGIICGPTGTSKSFSAVEIARRIDPNFTIQKNIVFTAEEFLTTVDPDHMTIEKGGVLVWDEAGTGVPSRLWWTVSNRAISFVMQTFRHLNIGLLFTVPSFTFIDSQARQLFHSYFETKRIDYKHEWAIIKPMNIEYSPRMGKIYYKHPNVNINGINIKVKELYVPKPPQEIIDDYEMKKLEFSKKLRRDVEQDVKKIAEEQAYKPIAIQSIANEVMQRKLYRQTAGKFRISIPDIMASFGCSYPTASVVRKLVLKQLQTGSTVPQLQIGGVKTAP